jgi:hypothetical protein
MMLSNIATFSWNIMLNMTLSHQHHSTMTNIADKLLLVSKIFADERLSELLAENRVLKLKLFWKDHAISQLQIAMINANQKEFGGPGCKCVVCAVCGRDDHYDGYEELDFDCTFKPYFETLLRECGLHSMNNNEVISKVVELHMSDDTGNVVYNADTHLVRIGRNDWDTFSYGSKLWKASSIDDPEIKKLQNLFLKLKEEHTASFVDDAMK